MSQPHQRLFINVYVDKDLSVALAHSLRLHGFDAIATQEVGNQTKSDAEQLAYAVSQSRAMLTANRDDFRLLYDEYWQSGRTHYGIIIATQLDVGELLRRMLRLLNNVSADEMMNTFRFLSDYR